VTNGVTRHRPPDQAGLQLLKERQDVATLQLTADDHFAIVINAVDLKYRLGNVETDCRDRLHVLAPPNRRGFNSTHIHGTHVPVEEPSTASLTAVLRQKGSLAGWQKATRRLGRVKFG
jgi:hypothetical protein